MSIGKQIKHYRSKLDITLEALSDASGVDTGTIHALEKRDSSRSKFFQALATAFGLTLEQLSDETRDYDVKLAKAADGKVMPLGTSQSQNFGWPFSNITPQQYSLLTDEEREAMENHILLFIKARGESAKQSAPAVNALSA